MLNTQNEVFSKLQNLFSINNINFWIISDANVYKIHFLTNWFLLIFFSESLIQFLKTIRLFTKILIHFLKNPIVSYSIQLILTVFLKQFQ